MYPVQEKGADNLYLQPINGSAGRFISSFRSADGISDFRFSPDGKSLALVRVHVISDVVLIRDAREQ